MCDGFDPIAALIGKYTVTSSDGATVGRIEFVDRGMFAHSMETLPSGEQVHGLAAMFGGRVFLATGPKDKVEIGAYRRVGKLLQGIWVPPAASGSDQRICGYEESIDVGADTFSIVMAHAIDGQPYTGQLSVEAAGPTPVEGVERVEIKWSLHDGQYGSFGLRDGEGMVSTFCFEPESEHAIAMLRQTESGWTGVRITSAPHRVVRLILNRD